MAQNSVSGQSEKVKPKEAAGWLALGVAGILGYEFFIKPKKYAKEDAERLERYKLYKHYTTDSGFTQIAAQWKKDNPDKQIPSVDVLLGPATNEKEIAKAIYAAKGTFGDNEDAVYNALGQINNIGQLWRIQRWWITSKNAGGVGETGKNFWDYLSTFLTEDKEKLKVALIMDNRPWYKGGTYGGDGDLKKLKKHIQDRINEGQMEAYK